MSRRRPLPDKLPPACYPFRCRYRSWAATVAPNRHRSRRRPLRPRRHAGLGPKACHAQTYLWCWAAVCTSGTGWKPLSDGESAGKRGACATVSLDESAISVNIETLGEDDSVADYDVVVRVDVENLCVCVLERGGGRQRKYVSILS